MNYYSKSMIPIFINDSGEYKYTVNNNTVDSKKLGQYTITYKAEDSSNNKATTVIRTVNVKESSSLICSQIVAYNRRGIITKWALYSIDNVMLYESGNYTLNEQWTCNLDKLSLEYGTLLYLKAIAKGDDAVYSTSIKYIPGTYTQYFKLDMTQYDMGSTIYYNGVVNSHESPPIMNCKKIQCRIDANVVFRWTLSIVGGKTIFTSPKLGPGDNKYEIDLATLNLPYGTLLSLKEVSAVGSDSSPYLHFKYMENNTSEPKILLVGSRFKTLSMYNGTVWFLRYGFNKILKWNNHPFSRVVVFLKFIVALNEKNYTVL